MAATRSGEGRITEPQYQRLVEIVADAFLKHWENGGREEWERKHPDWREKEKQGGI